MLFDEDVPRPLRHDLPGHDISTVGEMGWAGIRNGTLLGMAESAGFDVMLTCDRNMQYQQNIAELELALLVLAVPNKKLDSIRPHVPEILGVLASNPQPGTLSIVGTWRVRGT
jgi:hypothetical protein